MSWFILIVKVNNKVIPLIPEVQNMFFRSKVFGETLRTGIQWPMSMSVPANISCCFVNKITITVWRFPVRPTNWLQSGNYVALGSEDWLIFHCSLESIIWQVELSSWNLCWPFILDFIRSDQFELFGNFPVYFVNTENYPKAGMRVKPSTREGVMSCVVFDFRTLSPGKNRPEILICTHWGVSTFSQPRQILIDWTRTWKRVSFKAKFNFIPCLC